MNIDSNAPTRARFTPRETRQAQKVAAFIGECRQEGVSNSQLLISITDRWPKLSARVLVAAHFLDQIMGNNNYGRGH